ncbi:MAG: mannitol dehydrogenase family protein [Kordiimonadaceae bacterium]|jgi:fructuronate reductase|nr:mannitol dehydrogenase family protein [Kordiimonadaceae bacterium]MBT6033480.1 mannitol dehydrogenase family protein [Kordiimonadaceae bacterium]
MARLSLSTLSSLNKNVHLPKYQPENYKAGIVHLGVGAFHRAHQAWYTHQVLNQFGGDWRITGVSLRSAGVRDTMAAQDCLYTASIKGTGGTDNHIIGSIAKLLVAPENPDAVIDAIASAQTKVVTLTITEKGYCLNNSSGKLELDNKDINFDLSNLQSPKTGIGYLVAAVQKRMIANGENLTIISCDNLANNGAKLEAAVMGFAGAVDASLAKWICEHVSFPSTMVDRIVPATTADDKSDVANAISAEDQACVITEPFTQWVIEEKFAGPVPRWDKVGATYVNDVEPFEDMKLRLLNASHSTIAYLGCLAGYETVFETISDPAFKALINHMMTNELAPTLDMPKGFDVSGYSSSLIERFSNSALPHKTRQIAMDGSQKIPQRILPALITQLNTGGSIEGLTLAVAAWMRYIQGHEENGDIYMVDDPMSETFKSDSSLKGEEYINAILGIEDIFSPDLKQNDQLIQKLLFWHYELQNKGAKQTVKDHFNK